MKAIIVYAAPTTGKTTLLKFHRSMLLNAVRYQLIDSDDLLEDILRSDLESQGYFFDKRVLSQGVLIDGATDELKAKLWRSRDLNFKTPTIILSNIDTQLRGFTRTREDLISSLKDRNSPIPDWAASWVPKKDDVVLPRGNIITLRQLALIIEAGE